MQVNLGWVADLRELLTEGDLSQIAGVNPSGFSIGAIIELACLRSAFSVEHGQFLDDWAQSSDVLQSAFGAFKMGQFPSRKDMWASRGVEFFPLRGQNWAADVNYHPFESRFCKSAKSAGFGSKAVALSGAMFEMADNVFQHSGTDAGILGYHVSDGHVAFAIGDVGKGVLASLRENTAWMGLRNSKEALVAIIKNHASRRSHGGDGEGFKEVFRSLVDLNGIIELASCEGRVRVINAPLGRNATTQFTGACPGLQLSICCSLSGEAKERIFPA
jgi:hypothetical protein